MIKANSQRPADTAADEPGRPLIVDPPLNVHVINPRGIYTLETARAALGLAASTLQTEIKKGRLRVAKRAGKYLIPGEWLLEWIKKGEIGRKTRAPS
jgi:hypothetical protein